MKANLTRGNSITDSIFGIYDLQDLEDFIKEELIREYNKQVAERIKQINEQITKEFLGPSEPVGIFNYIQPYESRFANPFEEPIHECMGIRLVVNKNIPDNIVIIQPSA
jgi:hypothetical protein